MRESGHGFAILAALALAVPGTALAHGSTKPRHGGIMVVTGETQIETLVTAGGLDIFVSEEDQPLKASGLSGNASVKGSAGRVELRAQDGNRLRASGLVPAPGQAVVVTVINNATGIRSFATYQF